jgi:hypothetical protein
LSGLSGSVAATLSGGLGNLIVNSMDMGASTTVKNAIPVASFGDIIMRDATL